MKDVLEIKDNIILVNDYVKRIDILREDIEMLAIKLRNNDQNGKASLLAYITGKDIQQRLDMIVDYEQLIYQKLEEITCEIDWWYKLKEGAEHTALLVKTWYLSFKAIFNLWTFNLANQQIIDRRMKEW